MKKLGSWTKWGKVAAVRYADGERYYFLIKNGVVSMMPASAVEEKP